MVRLAANLSMLFTELPFLQRFQAAASAGFKAVEWTFAFDQPIERLRSELHDNGLALALLNTPPGNRSQGELGLAVLPGREADLDRAIDQALEQAVALEAPTIHFLAGRPPLELERSRIEALFLNNLRRSAARAAAVDKTLTLEPLNRLDRPGYFLNSNSEARRLIKASGYTNVALQLDLYHCQITEGNAMPAIERYIDIVGHVQIAGVPGRHEPDVGALDYGSQLDRLDALGYRGYVGCEYVPQGDTKAGLGWAARYLHARVSA